MSRSTKKKKKQKIRLVCIVVVIGIILFGVLCFVKLKNNGQGVPYFQKYPEYKEKDVFPGQDERKDGNLYIKEVKKQDTADEAINNPDVITRPEITDENTEIVESSDIGEGYLDVHFMDVGQGDSILVIFIDTNPDNGDDSASMLIDAGDTSKGTFVRNYLSKQDISELDYVVCSHSDADHIGGMASVINNVPVVSETVWGNGNKKDTHAFDNLISEIDYKGYSYEIPELGKVYSLGLADFMFIAPSIGHSDENNSSLVMKLWYGDISFLLTGDCEEEEELEIINGDYASYLSADVLKVGHHGSRSSTTQEFVSLISPVYAVISCGEDNSYGHPHQSALNNLREQGAQLFRTDIQGSLVASTDGTEIEWNASPCNEWSSPEK